MTPARWAEVCSGFAAALDRGPGERVEYLRQAFAHDPELRAQVARLLEDAQTAEAQGFLREPPWIVDDIPLFLPDFKGGASEFRHIEYIGHGGMGVVYKAYQCDLDKWVALKLILPHLTSPEEVDRFRREAQSMARLRHTNIVTVYETGEYEGRPYFVMDLIEGRSLTDCVGEFFARPKEAALLVRTMAFAIHHAHQRQILHNDLKPGNILLDAEGKPHITDFGLAKRLGPDQGTSSTGAVEGTACFMSPEQADGKEITTSSDVYGLGAILYTLLTGAPPFRAETAQATLELVRHEPPKPPRLLNSKVDRTLEAICLKCLRKDKAERHASANSLALDLGRYLSGVETLALPWNRRDRVLGWCKRNRTEAGLAAAVMVIWVFASLMALSVAQARKAHLLEATMRSASYTAQDLATTTLLQFRALSRNVELATADPKLADLLEKGDRRGLQRFLGEVCGGEASSFRGCFIIKEGGIMQAQITLGESMVGQDFGWRNYFQGARRLAKEGRKGLVHTSRVYRGRSDNLYKFAIAAPIFGDSEKFLGVVATWVTSDATFGPVFLHDYTRYVSLLAPRDTDGPVLAPTTNPDRYVVLFHPAYRLGIDPVEFPASSANFASLGFPRSPGLEHSSSQIEIRATDNYTDPVSIVAKEYEGRWIAGFAPVGNTGFVVVVQQRYDEAVSLEFSTLSNLAIWSGLATLVAGAILAAVLLGWIKSWKSEAE